MVRLLRRGVDGVFAHMIPQYVLASWPAARISSVPIVLWYAHGSVPIDLRIAYWLADKIVTPTTGSFNYRSGKLSVLSHGIDTERFEPQPGVTDRKCLLSVGRIAPVKNTHVLIRAVEVLREDFPEITLRIVAGESRSDDDYYKRIRSIISEKGLDRTVELVGAVPHMQITRQYQEAGVFVSASDTGSLDKTEIESMACGTPVVSSNESYKNMVETASIDSTHLSCADGDHRELAQQVSEILDYSNERYTVVSDSGRQLVEEAHSVSSLMPSVAAEFTALVQEYSRC
jgi:glycosyltransferase involved in cell wall biosynthesis